MAIPQHAQHVDPQSADVITWRKAQLTKAGFDAAAADELATDPRWDLHAILQLVERGCPPSLAMRIQYPDEQLEGRR